MTFASLFQPASTNVRPVETNAKKPVADPLPEKKGEPAKPSGDAAEIKSDKDERIEIMRIARTVIGISSIPAKLIDSFTWEGEVRPEEDDLFFSPDHEEARTHAVIDMLVNQYKFYPSEM